MLKVRLEQLVPQLMNMAAAESRSGHTRQHWHDILSAAFQPERLSVGTTASSSTCDIAILEGGVCLRVPELDGQAGQPGQRLREGLHLLRHLLDRRVAVVAQIDREPDLAGDHVDGAGKGLEPAHRADDVVLRRADALDGDCRVLDMAGMPIPGLYAAGSTIGGLDGGPHSGYVGGLIKTALGLHAAEVIAGFTA